jgi:hypothetical protein
MGLFDDMLQSVSRVVASILPGHPPHVVDSAVQLVARAHAGHPDAQHRLRTLAARSPRLATLLARTSETLERHPHYPGFRACGSRAMPAPPSAHPAHAAGLPSHGFPVAPLHPSAYAQLVHSDEVPHAVGIQGFSHPRGGPGFHGRRGPHFHGRDFSASWGGPFGWGAQWLAAETEELGALESPEAQGEPEPWPLQAKRL